MAVRLWSFFSRTCACACTGVWMVAVVLGAFSASAYAACASPAGVDGQFQYISSDYKYCDGTNWQTMTVSDTGNACATSGVLTKSGSDMQFCNGTHWISANGPTVNACAGTTAGTIAWKSADTRLEWCDGTDWKIVGGGGDPCAGKSIGEACNGTGALYLGIYEGSKYMIMPSGCADDRSEPSCSGGTDTVAKPWNDGGSGSYNVPEITDITSAGTPSSTSERGDYTTPFIAAISDPSQGGEHKAARYCDEMDYGGYTDWYLPSKSELAYIYCKSTPGSHNSSYPQENVDCGGSGPSNELGGFVADDYWASTEYNGSRPWFLNFGTGALNSLNIHPVGWARYFRCIRRY